MKAGRSLSLLSSMDANDKLWFFFNLKRFADSITTTIPHYDWQLECVCMKKCNNNKAIFIRQPDALLHIGIKLKGHQICWQIWHKTNSQIRRVNRIVKIFCNVSIFLANNVFLFLNDNYYFEPRIFYCSSWYICLSLMYWWQTHLLPVL